MGVQHLESKFDFKTERSGFFEKASAYSVPPEVEVELPVTALEERKGPRSDEESPFGYETQARTKSR